MAETHLRARVVGRDREVAGGHRDLLVDEDRSTGVQPEVTGRSDLRVDVDVQVGLHSRTTPARQIADAEVHDTARVVGEPVEIALCHRLRWIDTRLVAVGLADVHDLWVEQELALLARGRCGVDLPDGLHAAGRADLDKASVAPLVAAPCEERPEPTGVRVRPDIDGAGVRIDRAAHVDDRVGRNQGLRRRAKAHVAAIGALCAAREDGPEVAYVLTDERDVASPVHGHLGRHVDRAIVPHDPIALVAEHNLAARCKDQAFIGHVRREQGDGPVVRGLQVSCHSDLRSMHGQIVADDGRIYGNRGVGRARTADDDARKAWLERGQIRVGEIELIRPALVEAHADLGAWRVRVDGQRAGRADRPNRSRTPFEVDLIRSQADVPPDLENVLEGDACGSVDGHFSINLDIALEDHLLNVAHPQISAHGQPLLEGYPVAAIDGEVTIFDYWLAVVHGVFSAQCREFSRRGVISNQ